LTTAAPIEFRPGPHPGTVLPEHHGLGLTNVAPTVARHFGIDTDVPPLSAAILPPDLLDGAERIVTLVIDALGYLQLVRAIERGQAPSLAALCRHAPAAFAPITSTFPSTTVTALTTLGTGLPPGQHGVIGDKLYDARLGTTINVLTFAPVLAGWPLAAAGVDPVAWLGLPTIYERLIPAGVTCVVINHAAFAGTALSGITHRGARYVGCHTLADLCAHLRAAIEATPGPAYVHAYWGALDLLGHRYGVGSPQCAAELRVIDHAIGAVLLRGLRAPRTLLLILADHGQIDTARERWTWLNDHPELLGLLQSPPAGDHRAAVLHVRPGVEAAARAYAERCLADCASVLTVEEALGLGLYGPEPIAAHVRQRMGHLLVLARGDWVVRYEYPGKERRVWQIGTHGGLMREEMLVPLLALRLDERAAR
jgi:hypothetical protein